MSEDIITFNGQKYKKITDLTEVCIKGDSYIYKAEKLRSIGPVFWGRTFRNLFSSGENLDKLNPDFSAYRPITKTIKKII